MGGDPLDDIMGYLGLAPLPPEANSSRPSAEFASSFPTWSEAEGEQLIASAGASTLWLAGNEHAEWIELRGSFTTLRVTRPKARLLLNVRTDLMRWAQGESPQVKARDLTIAPVRRMGIWVLEIRYRTWKPLRLSRDQARAVFAFIDPMRAFAKE